MKAPVAAVVVASVTALLVATGRVPKQAAPSLFAAEPAARGARPAVEHRADRRLSLRVANGPGAPAPALGAADHARIAEALARAGGHVSRAKALLSRGVAGQDARALREGEEALASAGRAFAEARALIATSMGGGDERAPRKDEGADRDAGTATEDEERALDVTSKVVRHLYERMNVSGEDTIGFNECQGRLVKHCKTIINRHLRANGYLWGPQRINIQTYKKRPVVRDPYDEGSNKVIIVTDHLGDHVVQAPRFPEGWTWNGQTIGPWPECVGLAPDTCCLVIKNDVTEADEIGKLIECQFYFPTLGDGDGVRYPHILNDQGEPVDGIILYESLDSEGNSRVEEVPYLQANTGDLSFTFPGSPDGPNEHELTPYINWIRRRHSDYHSIKDRRNRFYHLFRDV